MDTNAEVRRRRLENLCKEKGGVRAVAQAADMNWQTLDQIIKKVLLPQRADGQRVPRSLGDEAARKLEKVYDLGRGWFDWPFENVEFKDWLKLGGYQRAFVEGQLQAAIARAPDLKVTSPTLGEVETRSPVSNRKVEKHLKKLPAGAADKMAEQAQSASKKKSRTKAPAPHESGDK